jgi:hypothetical protein
LSKWEQFPNRVTETPGNPYVYRPYPKMLYMAYKRNGQIRCMEGAPDPYLYQTQVAYERAQQENDRFNASCQRVVANDRELDNALGQGWRGTPQEAMAHLEALEQDIGNAAAEAAFHAKGMSQKAKDELAAADQTTHEHVTDVVGTPKSRRGSDAKQKSNAVAGVGRKAAARV